MKPNSVDGYIEAKPEQVRVRLNELRAYLRATYPNAQEVLKWGKPAFVDDGILCVYAGFKNHVSLHPTPFVISVLSDSLQNYQLSENTIQFPIDQTIPEALINQIALLRETQKTKLGMGSK